MVRHDAIPLDYPVTIDLPNGGTARYFFDDRTAPDEPVWTLHRYRPDGDLRHRDTLLQHEVVLAAGERQRSAVTAERRRALRAVMARIAADGPDLDKASDVERLRDLARHFEWAVEELQNADRDGRHPNGVTQTYLDQWPPGLTPDPSFAAMDERHSRTRATRDTPGTHPSPPPDGAA